MSYVSAVAPVPANRPLIRKSLIACIGTRSSLIRSRTGRAGRADVPRLWLITNAGYIELTRSSSLNGGSVRVVCLTGGL